MARLIWHHDLSGIPSSRLSSQNASRYPIIRKVIWLRILRHHKSGTISQAGIKWVETLSWNRDDGPISTPIHPVLGIDKQNDADWTRFTYRRKSFLLSQALTVRRAFL